MSKKEKLKERNEAARARAAEFAKKHFDKQQQQQPTVVAPDRFYDYEKFNSNREKLLEQERIRASNYQAFKAKEELEAAAEAMASIASEPTTCKFNKKVRFKLDTNRVILESFNPGFKCIDTNKPIDYVIVNITNLRLAVVVESIKKNTDSIILIYSESTSAHNKNYEIIKEDLFRGYQKMIKDLLAKPESSKAEELKKKIEEVSEIRRNLFSRMFLMSVAKNSGFDFPMINPLLLFFSSIINGHTKMSDIECRIYDPKIREYEPMKQILITKSKDDGGEIVAKYLYNNFFVEKKKIYFISNEFYYPTQGEKPKMKKQELLSILTGLNMAQLAEAFMEKDAVVTADDDHRVAHLLANSEIYKGKNKILIDAYEDSVKTKAFDCSKVKPIGYKLCHNIINYVDYLGECFNLNSGNTKELFRFFEIVPPALLFTSPAPHNYQNHIIKGYLEKHPNDIDQSWFGNELTYAQTERLLNQMAKKKIYLEKVFDDIIKVFPRISKSTKIVKEEKDDDEDLEKPEINIYIFIGEKFSGKTFMAKKFVEYLDSKVESGEETNATILNDYKKKLNSAIKDGKTEIVLDVKILNREYERRMFENVLLSKINIECNINFCFINIGILNNFKTMLAKYTKSAYPTSFGSNLTPAGFFQRNIKGSNVIDMTNCFWIDASTNSPDFIFEISRQIH